MLEFELHRQPEKESYFKEIFGWMRAYWFQIAVLFFLFIFFQKGNVQVVIGQGELSSPAPYEKVKANLKESEARTELAFSAAAESAKPGQWKSSDFKNLSFILNPQLAKKKGVDKAIVQEKLDKCLAYVGRFSQTAVQESEKFGMPASIKLAQGLLETDAGDSRLAMESNNHFGIKCRAKCRGCTCRNYSDDDVYDMFRVFDSAWESYREHSKLLQIDRYSKLKKLGASDYKAWATGLKKAGYATDKNYDRKLILIIEALDLHQFDK